MLDLSRYTGQEIKQNESALISVLTDAGASFKGKACCCVFCDDKHPSAGIYSSDGDGWKYKCHSCGFQGDIVDCIAKLDGVEVAEVFRRLRHNHRKPSKPQPPTVYPDIEALKAAMPHPVEEVYQYTAPDTGKVDMVVLRLTTPEGKQFRQASPVPGGFIQKAPQGKNPLYNRRRMLTSDTIVIVEGEGVVHALHSCGIVGTTSPGGAKNAATADWQPVAGKNLILWPDADSSGMKYMEDVEAICQTLEPAPRIATINPTDFDLAEKEDAADFIEQLKNTGCDVSTAINEALAKATTKGISADVGELVEDCISGKREAVKWPWSCIGGLSKALIPGTVTLLCGNVGSSKTFAILEAAQYWYERGVKIAVYEIEENRQFHLQRCLAQRAQESGMTDPDWIRENPELARKIFADNSAFLDDFGLCIYASPDTMPTMAQVTAWIEERAKAGCRIIAIDPVTALAPTGKNVWEADATFLRGVAKIATEYHCSIILVTHPIKTVSFPDVGQLQGGAAYSRFSQTIFWMESHAEKTGNFKTSCGTTERTYNRTMHLLKARNGRGQGVRIACNFEADTLKLTEIGIITKA